MAFVIFSTRASTRTGLRTLSVRKVVAGVSVLSIALTGASFAVGYHLGRDGLGAVPFVEPVALGGPLEAPPAGTELHGARGEALVARIGALAARIIRLESETTTLARRVGALPVDEAGEASKETPAAEPSGGPLLAPDLTAPIAAVALPVNKLAVSELEIGDPSAHLHQLELDLERIHALVSAVDDITLARDLEKMAVPSHLPVDGRRISSGFGNRRDPFTRRWARHSGIDFSAPRGTPIVAAAGGRVRFAGWRPAYGNTVEIDHGNGLVTRYAHASKLHVKKGELVLPRQEIAAVGSTGRSTGPHLHYEVIRNGAYVEPRQYFPQGT